jgi:hypothetical protein
MKQLISRKKVTGHEMQYPKNEFLVKNLIFGNLKMEITKEQKKTYVRLANKGYLVSSNSSVQLVYAKRKFNFIFLVFALDDRLKLLMFTFKKNIDVKHNAQNLKAKHVIFLSHFIQAKDSLELSKGKPFFYFFFQI